MAIIQSTTMAVSVDAARVFRESIGAALNRIGVEPEAAEACLLAGSEIIVNIAEHASPQANVVGATLFKYVSGWELQIWDDGGGFENVAAHRRTQDDNDGELNESGMGLIIVDALFPSWRYRSASSVGELNTFVIGGEMSAAMTARPSVLLVDDDTTQLEVVAALLADEFTVTPAESTDAALLEMGQSLPNIIVCDIRMPGGSGLDFRRRIRRDTCMATIPFIFLTGIRDDQIAFEADTLGIDAYLEKPVDKKTLISAIRRAEHRIGELNAIVSDRLNSEITGTLTASPPSRLGCWTCVARSEAASTGGGDLISFAEIGGHSIVVIADMMGHGYAAKFHAHCAAGFIAGTLRAGVSTSPGSILTDISRAFSQEPVLVNTIGTVAALSIAPDGVISIAAAGHPPPFLVVAGGVEPLQVAGPLPGLVTDPIYEEVKVFPNIGSKVLVATDGILEAGTRATNGEMNSVIIELLGDETLNDDWCIMTRLFDRVFERDTTGLKDDATAIILSADRTHG